MVFGHAGAMPWAILGALRGTHTTSTNMKSSRQRNVAQAGTPEQAERSNRSPAKQRSGKAAAQPAATSANAAASQAGAAATRRRRARDAGDARAPAIRRGPWRKQPGAESAQERILDAAEALFARHGFDSVTLRQVAERAGVDTALLHYYFGNKAGLFDKVFERRAQILNKMRMESLDRYEEAAAGKLTLEGVTDAFLRPIIDTAAHGGEGWSNYFALVAQLNNAPSLGGGATMTRYFDPVIQRFIGLLRELLPNASLEDIYWSFQQLTGALTLTLSRTGRIDTLSGGLCRSSDLQAAYARMLPYAVGGLRNVCQSANRRDSQKNKSRRRAR